MDRGTLAFTRGEQLDVPATAREGLFVRRRGGAVQRVSADIPWDIDAEGGRLVYGANVGPDWEPAVVVAVDLRSRRPRLRTLATSYNFDCCGRSADFPGSAVDGHFAYWHSVTFRAEFRGDFQNPQYALWRADLDDPRRPVDRIDLPTWYSSLAVDRGKVYLTRSWYEPSLAGVFVIEHPEWTPTTRMTPLGDLP
jgi:hypothetical protein